jgi:hypothetical protein
MFANTKVPESGSAPDVCNTPGPAPVPSPYPNMATAPTEAVVNSRVVVTPMLQGQDPAGGVPVPMPKAHPTIIDL